MLNSAKLSPTLRDLFWAEAARSATELGNIMITNQNKQAPYNQFLGKDNLHEVAEDVHESKDGTWFPTKEKKHV